MTLTNETNSQPYRNESQREDFEKVVAVTEYLPGWEVKSYLWREIEVQHKDGYGLLFARLGNRWVVTGTWPKDSRGQIWCPFDEPAISVSVNHTPKAIATHVRRRLLPTYITEWEKMKQRADISSLFFNQVKNVHDRLEPIFAKANGVYSFKVEKPTEVTLDIRCSPDVAQKIADLLIEINSDSSVEDKMEDHNE